MCALVKLELDHFFVFVEPEATESAAKLAEGGLVPSFRRRHEGQGTANLCYVFDNAYLELLWVEDSTLLSRATFRRTHLWERSRWKSDGNSPFGVCVRAPEALPFPCWLWQPPYLPPGLYLEVAKVVSDPEVPFLFRFPGTWRPDHWPDDRGGARQQSAGLAEITGLTLSALPTAEQLEGLTLDPAIGHQTALLEFSRSDGGPPRRLRLPDCAWLA
jgi:hypothetical protein